jgi:large subunit ribosomal protein L21
VEDSNVYAIVKTGGKQYRVTVGDQINVEKLAHKVGDEVKLTDVLLVADGENYKAGASAGQVVATVVGEGQGPKVTNFDYRNKHRRRVTRGHRQLFTRLEIKEIVAG